VDVVGNLSQKSIDSIVTKSAGVVEPTSPTATKTESRKPNAESTLTNNTSKKPTDKAETMAETNNTSKSTIDLNVNVSAKDNIVDKLGRYLMSQPELAYNVSNFDYLKNLP